MNVVDFFKSKYEIGDKRLEICRQCDRYDTKLKKCLECGCFMEYKAYMPLVDCPLNKWNPLD